MKITYVDYSRLDVTDRVDTIIKRVEKGLHDTTRLYNEARSAALADGIVLKLDNDGGFAAWIADPVDPDPAKNGEVKLKGLRGELEGEVIVSGVRRGTFRISEGPGYGFNPLVLYLKGPHVPTGRNGGWRNRNTKYSKFGGKLIKRAIAEDWFRADSLEERVHKALRADPELRDLTTDVHNANSDVSDISGDLSGYRNRDRLKAILRNAAVGKVDTDLADIGKRLVVAERVLKRATEAETARKERIVIDTK